MNFDYPDVPMRFQLSEYEERKAIYLTAFIENGYYPIVGLNSDGLFANMQMLYPDKRGDGQLESDEITISALFRQAMRDAAGTSDVAEMLEGMRVVNSPYISLHTLFADPGKAFVTEPTEGATGVTKLDGDFIVMTNFPVCELVTSDGKGADGVGAERYRRAYEMLDGAGDDFDVKQAFRVLEAVKMSGEFSTQCSLVFDPAEGEIYIALNRNYAQIWKASINNGSIESWNGLEDWSAMLGENGIQASALGGAVQRESADL